MCIRWGRCLSSGIAGTPKLGIEGEGHIWWVFLYVGDRPKRFSGWEGSGNPRDGGAAIVNYDTLPGEIRPDLNPDLAVFLIKACAPASEDRFPPPPRCNSSCGTSAPAFDPACVAMCSV